MAGGAAHVLKGMSGVIPASGVRDAAVALEEAIRAGAPWQGLAKSLEIVLESAMGTLPKLDPIAAMPAEGSADLDPERLGALLKELDRMLRRKSLSARKELEALRTMMGADPRVLRLEGCMVRLDFTGAQEFLAELAKDLGLPLDS